MRFWEKTDAILGKDVFSQNRIYSNILGKYFPNILGKDIFYFWEKTKSPFVCFDEPSDEKWTDPSNEHKWLQVHHRYV